MGLGNPALWQVIGYERRFRAEAQDDGRSRIGESGADCDIALAWASGKLSEQVTPTSSRASLRLGVRQPLNEFEALSGITHIAHPFLGEGSHEQEQVLERYLADQLNLIIEKGGGSLGTPAQHLIRGPLLRKLRGRLAYRLLDPRRTTVLAIDWDHRRINNVCSRSGSWEPRWPLEDGLGECYGPFPSLTIDAGIKSYELVVAGWRYIVEVPVCALPLVKLKEYFNDQVPMLLRQIAMAVVRGNSPASLRLPPLFRVVQRKAEDLVRDGLGAEIGFLEPNDSSVKESGTARAVLLRSTSAQSEKHTKKHAALRITHVMAVISRYGIAAEEKMAVRQFVKNWVTEMNREGAVGGGFTEAIIEEFNELAPPTMLRAAQPKNLGWVREKLGEIESGARSRLRDAC
jgi:hypothetical protein